MTAGIKRCARSIHEKGGWSGRPSQYVGSGRWRHAPPGRRVAPGCRGARRTASVEIHSTLDYLLCRSFNLELSRAAWPVRARPTGSHRPVSVLERCTWSMTGYGGLSGHPQGREGRHHHAPITAVAAADLLTKLSPESAPSARFSQP